MRGIEEKEIKARIEKRGHWYVLFSEDFPHPSKPKYVSAMNEVASSLRGYKKVTLIYTGKFLRKEIKEGLENKADNIVVFFN